MEGLPTEEQLRASVKAFVLGRKADGTADTVTMKTIRGHLRDHTRLDGDCTLDEWEAHLKTKEIKELLRKAAEDALSEEDEDEDEEVVVAAKESKKNNHGKQTPKEQKRPKAQAEVVDEEEASDGRPAKKRKREDKPGGFKSAEFINSEGDPLSPPKPKSRPLAKGKSKAAEGRDSDSVLDDEPASKKVKGRKKAKASDANLSKDDQLVKKLKSLVVMCGLRPRWQTEFAAFPDSPARQISHLNKMLERLGMKGGRLSEKRAKEIGEQRALEKEIESLGKVRGGEDEGVGPRRGAKAMVVESDEDGSDDQTDPKPKSDPFAFLKQRQGSSSSSDVD